MCNIIYKMRNKVPEGLFWFKIFLPAYMAIPANKLRIAVKTYFFFPFFKV